MPEAKKPAPKKTTKTCMVLKAGDGKISKGKRVDSCDLYYGRQERIEFPPKVAEALEARGYVEIMD